MPIILTALGLLASFYFYYMRARGAARAASDIVDVIGDAGAAVRRFRFKRRANVHPVESVEEPEIAIAALAAAFVELDRMPTKDLWDRLSEVIGQEFQVSRDEAEELSVLGRWLVAQCGTAPAAVTRLSKKLYRLSGSASATPLLVIVQNTLAPQGGDLSDQQREALHDVQRALRIQ